MTEFFNTNTGRPLAIGDVLTSRGDFEFTVIDLTGRGRLGNKLTVQVGDLSQREYYYQVFDGLEKREV